jgi:hypothetical protein
MNKLDEIKKYIKIEISSCEDAIEESVDESDEAWHLGRLRAMKDILNIIEK